MKKALYFWLLLLPGLACMGQKIGVVKGKDYQITYNTKTLKNAWQKILAEEKITSNLKSFSIVAIKNKDTGKTSYLLLALSERKGLKMAKPLELRKDGFYSKALQNGKTTNSITDNIVICQGCIEGCEPQVDAEGNLNCSPCPTKEKCTKTERVETKGKL